MTILTRVWGAQHPNADQNIQHMGQDRMALFEDCHATAQTTKPIAVYIKIKLKAQDYIKAELNSQKIKNFEAKASREVRMVTGHVKCSIGRVVH